MLWIAFAVLALVAILTMLLPLLSRMQPSSDRDAGSVSILADQLREVDTDAARGLISAEEARAAQTEIKRRLLAVSRTTGAASTPRAGHDGRVVLWIAALAVPLAAGVLYARLGAPDVPAVTFASRQGERDEQAQIAELTGQLLDRLQNDPAGGPTEGWLLLGQTYLRAGRYDDAAAAFANVVDRPDATSSVLSQYAEALVARDDGIVTPEARTFLRRARKMDPSNPAASYYEAVAMDQTGDSNAAYDLLVARLDAATGPAPWMEVFVAQANRIGAEIGRAPISMASFAPVVAGNAPGPTADDVASAAEMSDEDRAAFIRSMVARLADRLAQSPDDLDGWMRLANAYGVLGEVENAQDAYRKADALAADLPPDDPRKAAIRQALSDR